MNHWLVKSEPSEYSFDDLLNEGKTMWEGIRNYAARNHLRGMKVGDLVLFYHSRQGLEVVGICKVATAFYPDPTAEKGDWSVVDLVPVKRIEKPVSLKEIKAVPELQNMPLVRIGRLSVMPLTSEEFNKVLEMGDTAL